MSIPSKSDWGYIDKNDIELQYTFDMFFGMTEQQAWKLCQSHADNYQEELQSMPKIPFNFYAPILCKYIVSDKARGDSDGASCFIDMVAWVLKTQAIKIENETRELLINSARFVSSNQDFYDADADIYGYFREKFNEVEKCI